jgi:hypothetical protein
MKTLRPAVTGGDACVPFVSRGGKAATPSKPSAAYEWLDISLEATARAVDRHGARPTIISRTLANKEKAIAYATYRALIDVYPEDKTWIDEQSGEGI